MKKYILPLIALLVFSMYSCNEETTGETKNNAEKTTETKEATKIEPIKKVESVNNSIKKVENIKKEEVKPNTQKIANLTSLKMDRMSHDFGTITTIDPVKTTFTVTNTGKNPLIITNAKATCGCTVPIWPREPIAPGKSAKIEVSYTGKGKAGKQNKTVTITANTEPARTIINVKSVVNIK